MTQALIEALGLTIEMINGSTKISIKAITEQECVWGNGMVDYRIMGQGRTLNDKPLFMETVDHLNGVQHASGESSYPAEGIFNLLSSGRFDLTDTTTATRWPIGAQSPVVLR